MIKAQNITELPFLPHHSQLTRSYIKEYVLAQDETFKLGDTTNLLKELQDTAQSGKIVFTISQTK
jgi:hypothetical protein